MDSFTTHIVEKCEERRRFRWDDEADLEQATFMCLRWIQVAYNSYQLWTILSGVLELVYIARAPEEKRERSR
jgi:hypothetical protein